MAGRSKGAAEYLAKVAEDGVGFRELGVVVGSDSKGSGAEGGGEGLEMGVPVKGLRWKSGQVVSKGGGLALVNVLGVEGLNETIL